jgi:hypothetical protein
MNSASSGAVIVLMAEPISNVVCSSYRRWDFGAAQTYVLAVVPLSITAAATQARVRSFLPST